MAKKPFRITEEDRLVLAESVDDLALFTQYYFDGLTPHEYQFKFYHAPQKDKLWVAGVRSGKTLCAAMGFLHYAVYHPYSRLANASISADQANIVFSSVCDLAERPAFSHWVEDIQKHPYPKVILVNGAQIWFRSVGYEAELWRGHEFDWINIDEVAYIAREQAIKTLRGRLLGAYHVDGKQIQRAGIMTMMSSPKGKGWLFERWKKGDARNFPHIAQPDKYLSMRSTTRDNPALSKEAIADLEAEYTSRMRDQEIQGLFLDSDDCVFPWEHITYACDEHERPEVSLLNESVRRWLNSHNMSYHDDVTHFALEPNRDRVYLNSWDLGKRATKEGRNATVGIVLDITDRPWQVVAFKYAPNSGFGLAHEWITEWHRQYSVGFCETIIDATGKGDPVNERLEDEERIAVDGIVYSAVTKPQLIQSGQLAFEKGWVVFPFVKRIVDQLQSYEYEDKAIAQDIVMALCQALFRARQRGGDIARQSAASLPIFARRNPMQDQDRFQARRKATRTTRRR